MTPFSGARITPPRVMRLLGALLIGLIAIAFWPLPDNGFIDYDDPFYVTNNPDVNGGLTAQSIKWAFTTLQVSNWHPLTWLSHMLDCEFFGLNPRAHHWVNLVLHTVNALLLLLLMRRLTGSLWRSGFVAALFAVHPMHVESVAWVSERKDVLSTLFFMLTVLSYLSYVNHRPSSKRTARVAYGLTLVCFALGLLSKPMLVTLPCVLLLLDFWPLRRVQWNCEANNLTRLGWLLLGKIPFFVLTGLSCAVTVMAQARGGSMAPTIDISLLQRAANSIIACGWYVWRLFAPTDLSIIYPLLPERPEWQVIAATIVVVSLTGLVLWQAARRPWLLVGWLWFLGTLVPVIGLVQVGMQAYADRYTYLSYIGLFIALTWSVEEWTRRWPGRARVLLPAAVAILGACVLATRHQVRFWKNGETLYRHALAVTENNYIALNNLGFTLSERREFEEAIKYCEASLKIAPRFAEAYNTIGCARLGQKKPELALPAFEQAVIWRPNSALYRNNQGTALHELERYREAVLTYEGALQLEPDYADAHYNLGNSLRALGQSTNAIASYERAIALRPNLADAHLNLGYELLQLGRRVEARTAFERSLAVGKGSLKAHYILGKLSREEGDLIQAISHWRAFLAGYPDHAAARTQLAAALGEQNNSTAALTEAQEAIRRSPNYAPAHFCLAVLLDQQGRTTEAVRAYEETLKLNPEDAEALNNLAWTLTSCPDDKIRNGPRAVELARRACELTRSQSALLLGTLAAAYAEAGRFAEAITTAESARDLAQSQQQPELARKNEELLARYRAGKTGREWNLAPLK
jgi:tetratricopeptide (TPR) repeat protein